jgi:2-haloacid dehalogenase
MNPRLSDFDAVTFDVYGTLIDWEPSIIDFLVRWAAGAGLSAREIDLLMAFDRARADIQKVRPAYLYPDVLRLSFDRISKDLGIPLDLDVRERFAAAPHGWPPFEDSHDGLTALQSRMKVGALSNIDEASLQASCRRLDFTSMSS